MEKNNITFKKRVTHTDIACPFGSKKDIEDKSFCLNDKGNIIVVNKYGIYAVSVDMKDVI